MDEASTDILRHVQYLQIADGPWLVCRSVQ